LGDQTGLDRFGGSGTSTKGLLGKLGQGLIGGVDQLTGAQTGLAGAANALLKGNSPGTYNAIGMKANMVADPSQGGREMPNTASGMTAQQWADKFTNGDLSKVGAGFTNVNGQSQIDFFNMDNGLAKALHFGSIPATQLDSSLIGKPAATEDTFNITDPLAKGADLGAGKSAVDTSGYQKTGLGPVGSAKTGFTGQYAQLAHDLEVQYSLPEGTLSGIANVETGGTYNPDISNKSGSSLGLMQFQAPTAAQYGLSNPFDPVAAMTAAAQYAGDIANKQQNPTVGSIGLAYNQGVGGYNNLKNSDLSAKASDVLGTHFTSNRFGLPLDATVGDYINASQGAYQKGAIAPPSAEFDPANPPSPPSNPAYSAGLAAVTSTSNGIVPNTTVQENAPQGTGGGNSMSAGLGGLDQSAPEVDHTPAEAGSSLGGRGNSPSVADHVDVSPSVSGDPRVNEMAMHDISQPDSGDGGDGEKRGGRIHAHHYAAGGYAPINMMYGMPTESDIAQIASDEAGSGAGVLGPQLQALAAKGVLPSAKGGRIHAADGTGISTDQNDDSEFTSTPTSTSEPKYPPESMPVIGPFIKGVEGLIYGQSPEERFPEASRQKLEQVGLKKPLPPRPDEGGGDYMSKTPTLTQPKIPKVESNQADTTASPVVSKKSPIVEDLASTDDEKNSAPTQRAPRNVVAQDTTRKTSDAAQPGFGYIAPPPIDMRQIAALNFGANLLSGGDFGSNLSRAGQNYANTMLEQQKQQRETMLNQAQSAAQYGSAQSSQATAGKTGAEEEKMRVIPNIFGNNEALVLAGTPQDPYYTTIPMGAPGQSSQSGSPTGLGNSIDSTLDKYGSNFRNMNAQRFNLKPEIANQYQADFMKEQQEAAKVAASANSGLGDLKTMATALTMAEGSKLGMGVGSPLANSVRRIAYTAAKAMGYAGPSPDSDDPVVAQQELNKIRQFLANAQVGSITHNGAARLVEATANAQPGVELETESGNKLFTSLARQNVMSRDYQKVINSYGGRTGGMGTDVQQAYQDAMPTSRYNQEQDVLQELMRPQNSWKDSAGKTHNLVTDLLDGTRTKAQFDAKVSKHFAEKYPEVSNLSRWLVN